MEKMSQESFSLSSLLKMSHHVNREEEKGNMTITQDDNESPGQSQLSQA